MDSKKYSDAFSLLQAIESINNLKAFSIYIIPDNRKAANDLLYCLQHIHLILAGWASDHPLLSFPQKESMRRLDASQPSLSPQILSAEMYGTTAVTPVTPIAGIDGVQDVSPSQFISAGVFNTTTTVPISPITDIITEVASITSTSSGTNETSIDTASPIITAEFEALLQLSESLFWDESLLQTSSPENITPVCNPDIISEQSSMQDTEWASHQTAQSPTQDQLFVCNYSNPESSNLSHLAEVVAQESFKNLIQVRNLPKASWNTVSMFFEQTTEHHQHGVIYQRNQDKHAESYLTLLVADNTYEFQSPPNDAADQKPSDDACTGFLESLMEATLRQNSSFYFVGPALDDRWNHLVDSGDCLREQLPGNVEGITSPYWHLGGKLSGTAFHKEDCDLRSMNLVLYGFKIWLTIDTQDTLRFEEWVRARWGQNSKYDDQWVRHLNLIVPPSVLQTAQIRYRVICAGPGDMILTSPNQYHYVINMTTNLAISVNFLLPQEPIARKETLLCNDCGLYPLANQLPRLSAIASENIGLTRKILPGRAKRGRPRKIRKIQKQTIASESDACTGEIEYDGGYENDQRFAVIRELQGRPATCLVPTYIESDPPTAHTLRMAMAMRGRNAITQVWELRQSNQNETLGNLNMALIDRSLRGISQRDALYGGITICNSASQQSNLLRRLSIWHFAEAIEQSKSPIAMRASSAVVDHYAEGGSRQRYHKIKYRGDLLHMICGSHRGLLAFIPLQRDNGCGINDPEGQYQNSATKKSFSDFTKIYMANDDCTRVFCAIGTSFLDSWGYKDSCAFKYDDWLCRLNRDLSDKLVHEMAMQLDEGKCGCMI